MWGIKTFSIKAGINYRILEHNSENDGNYKL
jgi:hypothetical protein